MNCAQILDAAKEAVTKDRAATHGKPENTFCLIAQLWSARLGQAIRPSQVAIMMIDLKTARAWGNPAHADSWTDIAGYAACGGELAEEEGQKIAAIAAAGLAKTVASSPKSAAIPQSKALSTPPHIALNIDIHLNGCRAKDWALADDLRLFELAAECGFGLGDVARDMGRDSKAIKERYDLLTGCYRDDNGKAARKYAREDILAALKKAAAEGDK